MEMLYRYGYGIHPWHSKPIGTISWIVPSSRTCWITPRLSQSGIGGAPVCYQQKIGI